MPACISSGDPALQNGRVTAAMIRRIAPTDAGRARALRLEMLADTPLAFITTLAEAAERPHADYATFVTRCSDGWQNAIFIAEHGKRIVAQAGGVSHPEAPDTTMLYAVFVSPAFRGCGLLAGLVDAVAEWSRNAGRPNLKLEVVTSNLRARNAYQRLGFKPSGDPVPHPKFPIMSEQVLARHA
jgi:predicted GNAT family acetyltransferase